MHETEYDVLLIQDDIMPDTLKFLHQEISKQKSKILYLVIDTLGGVPEIGFRIMKLLDAKFDKIITVVPDKAMSTGTLMALGSDGIFMFHSSSLGPLDLQIEHPTDGSRISTLDVRDTMNTIMSHSEIAAERIYRQNYNGFGLGRVQAAKIAALNAQNLIKPIVDKIDPYHLHKSFRSADVGERYASILLKTRMLKDSPGVANAVSSILANDYATHSYAITLDEAKNRLFLTVNDLSELTQWPVIERYFVQTKKRVEYISIDTETKSKKQNNEPTNTKEDK